MKSFMQTAWGQPVVAGVILLLCSIVPVFFVSETVTATLTKVIIMALFALSLNVQLGYGGVRAIGHAMYFSFGAYGYTLITTRMGFGILPGFALAVLTGIVFAMVMGYICLKNDMMSFAFLNLGLSLLIYNMVYKSMYLGADGGLLNSPHPFFARDTLGFHFFTVAVVGVCMILLYCISKSPFIVLLTGCRENDERLLFLGVNTRRIRWFSHLISVVFAVLAGLLFAMRNMGAYPTSLQNLLSTEALIMCIVGGMRNFIGPIIGAFIVTVINTVVSNYTIYYQLVLGIVILACVLFIRGGVMSFFDDRSKARKKKDAQLGKNSAGS